jgi:hypothetical protein
VLQQVAQALHCPIAELIGDETTSSPEGTTPPSARYGWPQPACWATRPPTRNRIAALRSSGYAAQAKPRWARPSRSRSVFLSSNSAGRSNAWPAATPARFRRSTARTHTGATSDARSRNHSRRTSSV